MVVLCTLACVLMKSRVAHAQPKTLSGTWRATAMVERWNIGDWGTKCGPRPSGQGAPGGTVTINQIGSELSIQGAGRSYSTTNCWEQSPGLRRVSHSASSRGWANRCTTAASDPRRATVVTTISATDDAIHFNETGSYQFVLEGQNCTASVRRTRSFKLVQRAGETPPAASSSPPPASTPTTTATAAKTEKPPESPPPKTKACDDPGEPARLEVRPARKLMRPGETFSFRARVVDADGCPLRVAPTWSLAEGDAKISVAPGGEVTVQAGSPEGSTDVIASVAGKNVRVSVEVASTERYEALLEARGLNESGEADEAAVAVIATGSLGGGAAVAEDTAKKRKIVFAAVVGGAAFIVAVVGFVLLRRGSKKRVVIEEEEEEEIAPMAMRLENQPVPSSRPDSGRPRQRHEVYEAGRGSKLPDAAHMVCPVCKQEFPPNSLFCPADGTRLVKASSSSGTMRLPAGGICPTCGRGFPPDVKVCPEHQEPLVPAPLYNATATKKPAEAPRGKICPTCGTRYDSDATFCGKDGTTLVLVN